LDQKFWFRYLRILVASEVPEKFVSEFKNMEETGVILHPSSLYTLVKYVETYPRNSSMRTLSVVDCLWDFAITHKYDIYNSPLVDLFVRLYSSLDLEKVVLLWRNNPNITVDAYKDYIYALARNNVIDKAMEMVKHFEVKFPTRKLPRVIFTALIKRASLEEAEYMWAKLQKDGVKVDLELYHSLLGNYLKEVPEQALVFFEQMKKLKVPVNVVTYEFAFRAASKLKDADKALKLLSEMKESGIQPNRTCYVALASLLLSKVRIKEAMEIYAEAKMHGEFGAEVTEVDTFKQQQQEEQEEARYSHIGRNYQ